ncbi:MAG: DUF975 family protein, partial [Verrucomicrobiota bacterium]
PFEEARFKDLINDGTVTQGTLVWNDEMDDWLPFGQVSHMVGDAPVSSNPLDASGPLEDHEALCVECNIKFAKMDMLEYENQWVCAECKPIFFQRLQEGTVMFGMGGGGNTPNRDINAQARRCLVGNWGNSIGAFLIYLAISFAVGFAGAFIPFANMLAQILLLPPLMLGFNMFFLRLARRNTVNAGMVFDGFQKYGPSIGIYFFKSLFIGLAALLVAVPGIVVGVIIGSQMGEEFLWIAFIIGYIPALIVSLVMSCMYALPFYILADQDMGFFDALNQSAAMMKGKKWKLFALWCRFIGWSLLCICTIVGIIGFLWLVPYIQTAQALFYEDLKNG